MRSPLRQRRAFTIIEAVVSLGITVCAGSALLLGISTSLNTTDELLDETIAIGMAQQLMDEIAGKRYYGALSGGSPYQTTLSPAASEISGNSRALYDDIDDFNGVNVKPATDLYGITLGTDNGQGGARNAAFQIGSTYFARWRQHVDVYYVNAANLSQKLSAGQTSDFRAVEVTIYYDDPTVGAQKLASLRRVFAYVPVP